MDANNPEAMSNLMKVIFNKRNKQLRHLRKGDGTLTCSWEEVLDTLLDSFFPDSTPVREVTVPKKVFVTCTELKSLFSCRKIEEAFKSFKKKKSPGPDGIKPELLHNLDKGTLKRLAAIYNASLTLGYVPKTWRGAKAVLIPKIGKRDYEILHGGNLQSGYHEQTDESYF